MPRKYEGVTFTRSLRPVNSASVHTEERELAVVFSDDYRAFLLAVNGGVPTPSEFTLAEPGRPGERAGIDFLFGVAAKRQATDLRYEQEKLTRRVDSLPAGFVIIGHDGGGAPSFISTTGERAGGVYCFDPDGFLDLGGSPKLYLAARSFVDLLSRLADGVSTAARRLDGGRDGW